MQAGVVGTTALFTLRYNALLKNTVLSLLNTHISYTEKRKVLKIFLNIIMEISPLDISW